MVDTLLTNPKTFKFAGIGLVILFLIGILIIILNRTNPVTGTLYFEVGSQAVATIPIGSGWNVTKISRASLNSPANQGAGLKSLKVSRSREQAGWVEYHAVDLNNNPFNNTLAPSSPVAFTGGMTVRYEPLDSGSNN